jgi:RNA polymerase sigma-70 factor (ECF subfamily)
MRPGEDQLKAWMIAGLNGDAASHTALLRALVPLLRQFYRRRIGDDDATEDLVQDTLIAVHTRRMTYDRDRPFAAWLFAVARYKMIDHLRRVRSTVSIDDLVLASDSFEDAVNARMDIDHMLEALPERQARLIRDTRIDGQSIAEVARASGRGESDVKVSIHRGLKALAARIRGGGA